MKSVPLREFTSWLPSELIYSARKAGYDQKVQRAHLPIEDPRSIYGALGSEWFTHQERKRVGAHYMPFHGKSAQLQLAKFAAGIFDKVAVGYWLRDEMSANEDNFIKAASEAAADIAGREPWLESSHPSEIMDLAFEDTPFSAGIKMIMAGVRQAAEQTGPARTNEVAEFVELAVNLGGLAVSCYENYAETNLTPSQQVLPVSQLAG